MALKVGDAQINCLGHSTVCLTYRDLVIYIDPFVLKDTSKKADIIFISHEHYDHLSIEKINLIRKSDTVFVTNELCCSRLEGDVRTAHVGETIEVKGVKITGVEAYNIGKSFHPKGKGIGFVIEFDDKKVYFAGDTDLIPEMRELSEIDVAFLPISGTFVMSLDEAVSAAKIIMPKICVPMHYNVIDGAKADPEEFKKKLDGVCKVEILYK